MSTIEQHVRTAFSEAAPLEPLTLASEQAPVLATPALGYGAMTFAAYMAGNVVTDFDGDEAPTAAGWDDLNGKTGAELLALRSQHIRTH